MHTFGMTPMNLSFLRKCLVTLLVATALVLSADGKKPAPEPKTAPPATRIAVEVVYPGANAGVVAETVAAPIEQQVNGVEGLLHLRSRCTDDGRCVLTLTFRPGTDLNAAIGQVQKRVALAEPGLPDLVRRHGISIKRPNPGPVMLLRLFADPEQKKTRAEAAAQVRDALLRLPGVGDVVIFGQTDQDVRVWLDPDRLAAQGMTVNDVIQALQALNVQVRVGQKPVQPGQPIRLTLDALKRPADVKVIEQMIVKATSEGRVVRLKDVARVELWAEAGAEVRFNGKPCVVVAVHPQPGAELAKLREALPEGVKGEVLLDLTAMREAEFVMLDFRLPSTVSAERAGEILAKCADLLHGVPGVQDLLALGEDPFDLFRASADTVDQPCILVRLSPAGKRNVSREEVMGAIRTKLAAIPEVAIRLRPLPCQPGSLRCGYPVELAVSGPEADRVRILVEKFSDRLRQGKQLTDVGVNHDSTPREQLLLDIDRAQCATLEVPLSDVISTVQVAVGAGNLTDINRFGRTWQVGIRPNDRFRAKAEDLQRLKVRNNQGRMIALGSLAKVRTITAPRVIVRLDMKPAVEVSANLVSGVTPEQARAACEAEFAAARRELKLSDEYRLTWLQEIPATAATDRQSRARSAAE